jgi:hypothetical protein
VAGRKAAADGQTTAHRSRPALSAGHNKFPPQDLGTPQGSPAETIEADICTEVLTCAMRSDFAVNVICYGYGGLAQASATRLLNFQPSGSTQPQTWRSAIAGRHGSECNRASPAARGTVAVVVSSVGRRGNLERALGTPPLHSPPRGIGSGACGAVRLTARVSDDSWALRAKCRPAI